MRKPFIAGNWKMYKTISEAKEFAHRFKELYRKSDVNVAICAPFTQLLTLKQEFSGSDIKIAAQNVHYETEGAFTGEISCGMLKELGIEYVIIGHSERRQYFGETDETVNLKMKKSLKEGLLPILCVGENLQERESGRYKNTVEEQIRKAFLDIDKSSAEKVTVAYEPIWAIGTGKTATGEQANEMCGYIRDVIENLYGDDASDKIIIQYGGSVKPENISEIMSMPEIDGALVGGASLNAESFIDIVNF